MIVKMRIFSLQTQSHPEYAPSLISQAARPCKCSNYAVCAPRTAPGQGVSPMQKHQCQRLCRARKSCATLPPRHVTGLAAAQKLIQRFSMDGWSNPMLWRLRLPRNFSAMRFMQGRDRPSGRCLRARLAQCASYRIAPEAGNGGALLRS